MRAKSSHSKRIPIRSSASFNPSGLGLGRRRGNALALSVTFGLNAADEIEKRLAEANMLPHKKIPRSNLNRLLSAEAFRNRVGFSGSKGKFELTHDEPIVLRALGRIADDLANRYSC